MSLTVEQMYQEIGSAALGVADDLSGKLIVYSEVEDGVISADIFYENRVGDVRYRFAPKPLQELIYSFWEQWAAAPGNREWRAMTYVIEGGKFVVDLTYPDQIDPDADLSERRPLVVKKQFGDMKIDYSKPK